MGAEGRDFERRRIREWKMEGEKLHENPAYQLKEFARNLNICLANCMHLELDQQHDADQHDDQQQHDAAAAGVNVKGTK